MADFDLSSLDHLVGCIDVGLDDLSQPVAQNSDYSGEYNEYAYDGEEYSGAEYGGTEYSEYGGTEYEGEAYDGGEPYIGEPYDPTQSETTTQFTEPHHDKPYQEEKQTEIEIDYEEFNTIETREEIENRYNDVMKKLIAAGIDPEALLAEDEDEDLALLDALPKPKSDNVEDKQEQLNKLVSLVVAAAPNDRTDPIDDDELFEAAFAEVAAKPKTVAKKAANKKRMTFLLADLLESDSELFNNLHTPQQQVYHTCLKPIQQPARGGPQQARGGAGQMQQWRGGSGRGQFGPQGQLGGRGFPPGSGRGQPNQFGPNNQFRGGPGMNPQNGRGRGNPNFQGAQFYSSPNPASQPVHLGVGNQYHSNPNPGQVNQQQFQGSQFHSNPTPGQFVHPKQHQPVQPRGGYGPPGAFPNQPRGGQPPQSQHQGPQFQSGGKGNQFQGQQFQSQTSRGVMPPQTRGGVPQQGNRGQPQGQFQGQQFQSQSPRMAQQNQRGGAQNVQGNQQPNTTQQVQQTTQQQAQQTTQAQAQQGTSKKDKDAKKGDKGKLGHLAKKILK